MTTTKKVKELPLRLQREAHGAVMNKSRGLNNARKINSTYLDEPYQGNPQGKIDYKQQLHTSFQECIDMNDYGFFCVDVRDDMREILGALLLLIGCTRDKSTNLMSATYTHPSGELVATISIGDYRREDGAAGWLDCQAVVDILKQETDNV